MKGSITTKVETGMHPLQLQGIQSAQADENSNGLLYIPKNYQSETPAPLAVLLHGSGAHSDQALSLLSTYADDNNIILLAPDANTYTWDLIANESFDKDVILLDQALTTVFEHYAINPARIAIGGFSDGASYALSLGLGNGDLFTHIIAFSPGFVYTQERVGKPEVFVSHGQQDTVLPIDPCGRRVVARLQGENYLVHYHEFADGHTVPAPIAQEAVSWFCADTTTSR